MVESFAAGHLTLLPGGKQEHSCGDYGVSGNKIETRIDAKSAEFVKNTRQMIERVTEIKTDEEAIGHGGGAKAIEAQHKKGRLTARERIAKLIDSKTQFFELGAFAAFGMYEEWGGAPSAGTVTGLGRV